MQCLQHGPANSPLARYCAECGKPLSFRNTDAETFHRELSYTSGSLGGYGELVLVCDSVGRLHALDPQLNDLVEPLPVGILLDDHPPATAGGYVYLAEQRGILSLDLIAWLQGERPEPMVMDVAQASCWFSTAGDSVAIVTKTASTVCLLVCKGQKVINRLPLSDLQPGLHIFPPTLHSGFAMIAQRSHDFGLVCDLKHGKTRTQPLGGICGHASATSRGAACLIDERGIRRVVEIRGDGLSNLIPLVPPDTTWFLEGNSPRLHMWGNGSSLTLTNSGIQRTIRQSGNIEPPVNCGNRAVALSSDGIGTEILSIDLSNGEVQYPGRRAGDGYRDTACAGGRIVIGNGKSLTSISAEVK